MDISFLHRPPRGAASDEQDFADTQPLESAPSSLQPAPHALPPSTGFVRCSWLLNPKKQIIGFHFQWLPASARRRLDPAAHLSTLVRTLEEALVDRDTGWKLGKAALVLDVSPDTVPWVDWGGLPPRRIILRWRAEELHADAASLLKDFRARGFNHMVGATPTCQEIRDLATHVDVGDGGTDAVLACHSFAAHPVRPVATAVANWPAFDLCAQQDVAALVAVDIPTPPRLPARSELQAEGTLIVRLLQMVQRNEPVRAIEAALKHDAALTFRLLHHINSPAVGAGVQIESLRHAVAMLGYARLFRFLSMLLSTGEGKSTPPCLTHHAIVRGRFVELLGQGLLGGGHADNLFLVGMFSLLDRILGVSMSALLEQVQLAEAVRLAILDHEGLYGPFLKLALACEGDMGQAEGLADMLFIDPAQVNAARLSAIAWAHDVSRSNAAS
jgi:hypothetical protein